MNLLEKIIFLYNGKIEIDEYFYRCDKISEYSKIIMNMKEIDMPNIFDGLRKISDNDVIEQIALLETMNMTNISKPIVQKARKKTISIINFLGSKIGKNHIIEEPEVKEIWTLINEKKNELKNDSRTELDERLFNCLMEKVKNDIEDPTEDEISIEIIEEAAKLYKLYKNSTPGQKADKIYSKYSENLKGKAKEYINEQPFIDLQETTEDIQEILNNMDEEQKRNFEQSVDIEKITLLNVWKKIDRQHFARIVWLSVKAYEGRFTPKEEILPSFVKNEKEDEAIKIEENLKKSQEELLQLKNKIESYKDKINDIENNLEKENRLLNNAIKNKNIAEEDLIDLGKMNGKLESVKKSQEEKLSEIKSQMEHAILEELDILMEEFKVIKFDTIDINNKISDINLEAAYKSSMIEDSIKLIANKEENIKNINSEFKQLKIEAENLVKAYGDMKDEVQQKEDFKINEVFDRWSKFFDKFTFEFKNLRNIVHFSREELLHIEECLYELHFTKDPAAMSMGIIESKGSNKEKEEYEYIDISFPDKFKVEIEYKVLDNQEKNVHIAGITTEF